jgi:hypothetical protein
VLSRFTPIGWVDARVMMSGKPDLSEFDTLTEVQELRRANATLQAQLRRAKAKTEDLVDATIAAAHDAMVAFGPVPEVPAPKHDGRKRSPEVALWHLSDWQGAKITTSYNSEVMRERVLRYCDKAHRLTEIQRGDHPVRDCVVAFGGDVIEGLFNFPQQVFEIDATIHGQFIASARLVADVVRRALAEYEQVEVFTEWGNHGRIGSKRSAVPRADNLDRMVYTLAREIVDGHDRLIWHDCPEDIQKIAIGNYHAMLVHGDETGRNGYVAPGTFANWVIKQQSGALGWPFTDVYVGHYHQHKEDPLPNGLGSIYYTGSVESDNRYARDSLASTAVPSQRLNFVDPEEGRVTVPLRVWLD